MGVLFRDERIIKAHEDALLGTLPEIEKLVHHRTNDGNRKSTGNCCFALFTHKFSRSGDPQIHTHIVIPNITYDAESNTYRSIEPVFICKAIKYLGMVYKTKLAENILDAGYSICEAKNSLNEVDGFEIKGISASVLNGFQKRRDVINEHIKLYEQQKGRRADIRKITKITQMTRSRDMLETSEGELINKSLLKLSREEFDQLNDLKKTALEGESLVEKENKIKKDDIWELIEISFLSNFVKKPEVSQHEVLYDLLRWTIQRPNYEKIEQVFKLHCSSIDPADGDRGKLTSYISQKTIASEANIIDIMNRKMFFEMPLLYKMPDRKKIGMPEIKRITKSHDQFIFVKNNQFHKIY